MFELLEPKTKFKGFLTGSTVAVVTCYVTKMILSCSTKFGNLFDGSTDPSKDKYSKMLRATFKLPHAAARCLHMIMKIARFNIQFAFSQPYPKLA